MINYRYNVDKNNVNVAKNTLARLLFSLSLINVNTKLILHKKIRLDYSFILCSY
jgi:hypothetical protein